MDEPGVAAALLREHLPAEVAALLAPDAPELLDAHFVAAHLRHSQADRLYKARALGDGEVYIYVLLEHKSAPDPEVGVQLLGYLAEIWRRLDAGAGRHDRQRAAADRAAGDLPWRAGMDRAAVVRRNGGGRSGPAALPAGLHLQSARSGPGAGRATLQPARGYISTGRMMRSTGGRSRGCWPGRPMSRGRR